MFSCEHQEASIHQEKFHDISKNAEIIEIVSRNLCFLENFLYKSAGYSKKI